MHWAGVGVGKPRHVENRRSQGHKKSASREAEELAVGREGGCLGEACGLCARQVRWLDEWPGQRTLSWAEERGLQKSNRPRNGEGRRVWRRGRACALGKVDGQTSRRSDAHHLGKEQEKLAEGRERYFSDSRLITFPAQCSLLHPVAMRLAMRLPLRHLCRSLSNVLQRRT